MCPVRCRALRALLMVSTLCTAAVALAGPAQPPAVAPSASVAASEPAAAEGTAQATQNADAAPHGRLGLNTPSLRGWLNKDNKPAPEKAEAPSPWVNITRAALLAGAAAAASGGLVTVITVVAVAPACAMGAGACQAAMSLAPTGSLPAPQAAPAAPPAPSSRAAPR